MADTKVVLKACHAYDRDTVTEAVDAIFAQFGGITAVVKPGQRVLIKVNLLMKRKPEQATTTHPEVAYAIVRAVQRAGAIVILADSPGGPYTKGMLEGIYNTCGMTSVASETGCLLNEDFSITTHYYEQGKVARKLDLIGILDHVDAVITVGKLKTHGFTTMTGCVKNLYGLVPGTTKVEYHSRYPSASLFSDMILDICEHVKPCFAFVDGIVGMEGEGPSGGKPRTIGALIGGRNLHAVDAVAASLIGLRAEQVATLAAAKRRSLLPEYEVMGDNIEQLILRDFDIPMKMRKGSWVALMNKLPQPLRPRPVFTHKQCNGCAVCMRSCPVGAISMDKKQRPNVDVQKCIRCFCCQELCPKNDIIVRRNPLFNLLK